MVSLWKKQFEIQSGEDNLAEEANALRLGNRIQWYVANWHNIFSMYDSRLASVDINTIYRMSRDQ